MGVSSLPFPLPSVDRPFGIYLWPLFDEFWLKVTGSRASNFLFVVGETPLSTWTEVIVGITAYYVIILGGRAAMSGQKAMTLNFLFQVHNIMLTILSLVLWMLLFEQIFPILVKHGVFYAICNKASWSQPVVFVYYLNYITKYIELLDTVFLVLKKKPLQFLHCYHHGATAFLCFTQLLGHTSISFVPIILNLTVHVVMYFYYFLSARGIRVWWKQWVTRLQIIQFVIDIVFIYFGTYTHFAYTYFPFLPHKGGCFGKEEAAVFGCAIITSYLFLFLGFYAATYSRKGATAVKNVVTKGKLTTKTLDSPSPKSAEKGSNGQRRGATRSRKV